METVNGQNVSIEADGHQQSEGFAVSDIAVTDAQGRSANVIIGNIEAENGVVHVVDRVLLPLFDTVVDIAASFDDFSTLVAAVTAANLDASLRGPGPFTVFAPNNKAFNELLTELSLSIDELLALPNLSGILLYHVIGRSVLTDDLENGPLGTLFSQNLTVNTDHHPFHDGDSPFTVKGIALRDQQHRDSNVILTNVQARNGVVHVIDRVLLPLFETVVQIATTFDDFSVLVEALTAANLVDTLQGPGPFTVFAPTNSAFDALNMTTSELLALPNLSDILLYHVVGQRLSTGNMTNGQSIGMLNGQNVDIRVDEGITLNDEAQIGLSNVKAANGIVHVIDSVLTPK